MLDLNDINLWRRSLSATSISIPYIMIDFDTALAQPGWLRPLSCSQ
ncbi:hypothetical protein [Paludibacterium denitrificans]|uniref:Uncharacterized protein n=1 Tax=Paludibacterium denitrificans TaxID=2675226 RepID=A0A844G7E6_9NEIS|nr:hypothetical protein [Paludibacterium denitrificans]MTD32276.1 hypothetical protein [Paludibacterium denitrificans]